METAIWSRYVKRKRSDGGESEQACKRYVVSGLGRKGRLSERHPWGQGFVLLKRETGSDQMVVTENKQPVSRAQLRCRLKRARPVAKECAVGRK